MFVFTERCANAYQCKSLRILRSGDCGNFKVNIILIKNSLEAIMILLFMKFA